MRRRRATPLANTMSSLPSNHDEKQPPAILVVDDDPDVCLSLSTLLRMEGYAVTLASRGQEAIAALEHRPFDLVILDIALQHIDGVHIANYMRKRWPEVRIAIHSGTAEAGVRSRFSDYDAFLSKAGSIDSLLKTVARLAGNAS